MIWKGRDLRMEEEFAVAGGDVGHVSLCLTSDCREWFGGE